MHTCYMFIIYHFSYIMHHISCIIYLYIHISHIMCQILYIMYQIIYYTYCLSTKDDLYATYQAPPAYGLQEMEARACPIKFDWVSECGGSINDK